MNGHARDSVLTDIRAQRPALSKEVDGLVVQISGLMSDSERAALDSELTERAAKSPRWAEWVHDPDRFLIDFDPQLVDDIASELAPRLVDLQAAARERGWDRTE